PVDPSSHRSVWIVGNQDPTLRFRRRTTPLKRWRYIRSIARAFRGDQPPLFESRAGQLHFTLRLMFGSSTIFERSRINESENSCSAQRVAENVTFIHW